MARKLVKRNFKSLKRWLNNKTSFYLLVATQYHSDPMAIKTKYFWLKLFLSLILVFGVAVGYFYLHVSFKISNQRAENQQYKAIELQTQTFVYIPYEITVANNRSSILSLKRIVDHSSFEDLSFYDNLIFTADGIKIDRGSSKLEKSSRTILPFTTSKFYYFKRHTLANHNSAAFKTDPESFEQLNTLNAKATLKIPQKIIDSLYQSDFGKRFNIHFGGEKISDTKFAKLKISEEKQQQVILGDTLKGMDKEAAQRYLLKYASTDGRENLKDF